MAVHCCSMITQTHTQTHTHTSTNLLLLPPVSPCADRVACCSARSCRWSRWPPGERGGTAVKIIVKFNLHGKASWLVQNMGASLLGVLVCSYKYGWVLWLNKGALCVLNKNNTGVSSALSVLNWRFFYERLIFQTFLYYVLWFRILFEQVETDVSSRKLIRCRRYRFIL